MAGINRLDFDSPDEVRSPGRARVDVVKGGDTTVSRITAQPGWKWSEDIKPIVGGERCQKMHVGLATAGTLHVVHEDGSEGDVKAGEGYVVEPGHDAWVVGDEPFVGYEFEKATAETFAKEA